MQLLNDYRTKAKGLMDLLPYAALIDNGVVLNKDGSFTAAWICKGRDTDSADPVELELQSAQFNHAAKLLGTGWMLHMDAFRNPHEAYSPRELSHFSDPITQMIDDERRSYFSRGACYTTTTALSLTYKSNFQATKLAGQAKSGVDSSSTLEKALVRFKHTLNEFEEVLSSVLSMQRLVEYEALDELALPYKQSDLLSHLQQCLMGHLQPMRVPNIPMYLDSLLGGEELVGGINPRLGEQYIAVLSLDGLPSESQPSMLYTLDKLPISFRWNTRAILLDQYDATKEIEVFWKTWNQQVFKFMDKFLNNPNARPNRDALVMRDDAEAEKRNVLNELAPYLFSIGKMDPYSEYKEFKGMREVFMFSGAGEEFSDLALEAIIAVKEKKADKFLRQHYGVSLKQAEEKSIDMHKEKQDAVNLVEEIALKKTFLAVPFAEKEQAKALGARWDVQNKSWYASEGTDLAPLKAWLPDKTLVPAEPQKTLDPHSEFAKALEGAGLDLRGSLPEMDGKIHRVPLLDDKPGALNGAYCGYTDGVPAGWMQNYRVGEKAKWVATGHVLTDEQKTTMKHQASERCALRLQEQEQHQQEVAAWCSQYFDGRSLAQSDHAYLVEKNIKPEGLKVTPDGKDLVVPLTNTNGEIRSLQYIGEDGSKRFQPGGEKRGNFALLGADIKQDEKNLASGEIILAEGMATGASIQAAVGKPVVVAFDAGNLESVAVKLREKFPNAAITICADNDHKHTKENVGSKRAEEAAKRVGGKVIIPKFTKDEMNKGLTDFNDLQKAQGLQAVTKQVTKELQIKLSKGKGLER